MYRSLAKGDGDDDALREILLPGRTREEVALQLVRIEDTIKEKERRGGKLESLRKDEEEEFEVVEKVRRVEREEDRKVRAAGLDNILGLGATRTEEADETSAVEGKESVRMSGRRGNDVMSALDQVLGLQEIAQRETGEQEEPEEQRRKRGLDEALGLTEV